MKKYAVYRMGWGALLIALCLLSACSNTRYLSEDEQLYTGAEFEIKSPHSISDKTQLKSEVEQVIRPEPNSTFLGMRPGLWLYNIAGNPKKEKGMRHFIKYRMGQAPVLYRQVEPGFVSKLIENRLHNHGYFNARTDYEIFSDNKKVALKYSARVQRPYRYDSITYRLDSTVIGSGIQKIKGESLLKTGDRYNLNILRDERERIEREMKNRGFYYFNRDDLFIEADTTGKGDEQGSRKIDLFIGLQRGLPDQAVREYRMNDIYIFPDYQLGDPDTALMRDTLHYNGYIIANRGERSDFRPRALTDKINFKQGELYSRDAHDYTIKRTMGTGAFKYVDVRLKEKGTGDAALLDAFVYMTPLPKKTISARLTLVSKSNNYAGPGLEATWLNRNVFGGAELLKIRLDGGFETQFGGGTAEDAFSDFKSYQFGTKVELSVPRFLLPFSRIVGRKYSPQTRFGLAYEYVNRLRYFQLSSVSFTSGYLWNETDEKQHDLNPLVLRYMALNEVTDDFQMILDDNPFLRRSFSEQYILGPEYTYTFNNQVNPDLEHHIYLRASGNFSNPFNLISGEISTYYRLTADFRYYRKVSRNSKLITRVAGGIGIPYGDSESLPYVKQFFTGGPNSIRAFRARTVGPGSVEPGNENEGFGFQDQNGNIKLELNLEYRFDIYGIFKGAFFADAGNIWLHEVDPNQPGGVFETDDFLTELAVGAGLGLRMDISYFVLRFDLGWPLRKPYLPKGNRWIRLFDEPPTLNVSIGYPF